MEEKKAELKITKIERRPVGGSWITGTIANFRFYALVFEDHAMNPNWELETSRISKLSIQPLESCELLYCWDRGLNIPAASPLVQEVLDFLTHYLAGFLPLQTHPE